MKTIALLALLVSMPLLASTPPVSTVETHAQQNGTLRISIWGKAAESLYVSLKGVGDTANAGFEGSESTSRNGENLSCTEHISFDFVVTPTSKPLTKSYSCSMFVDAKGRVTAD